MLADQCRKYLPLCRRMVSAAVLVATVGAAVAGPLEDGHDAHKRKDYGAAMKFILPLAENGNPEAQWMVGFMHWGGNGIPKDDWKAAEWFKRAAGQGHRTAQALLGLMYDTGAGVPEDDVFAYMWFNVSAAQGNERAVFFRDNVSAGMTRDEIAEAQPLTREWEPKPENAPAP